MTQEKKRILLKDLCGRLPYGVYGLITFHKTMDENSTFNSVIDGKLYDRFANLQNSWYDNIPSIKPYLRPLSTMTDEERNELSKILNYEFYIDDDFALAAEDDRHRIRLDLIEKYTEWLNSKHFDYHGLIPMGLAIETTNPDNIIVNG